MRDSDSSWIGGREMDGKAEGGVAGVRSFVLWVNNGNKSHHEITLLGSEGVYGKLAVDRVAL